MESRESRLLRGELIAAQESIERLGEDAALRHGEHEATITKQVEKLNSLQYAARAHTEQLESSKQLLHTVSELEDKLYTYTYSHTYMHIHTHPNICFFVGLARTCPSTFFVKF